MPRLSQCPNAHVGWDVWLRGKWIDKVFFTPDCDAEYVRRSLVEHDGYDPGVTVRREKMKEYTYDEQLADHDRAVRNPRPGFESALVKILSGIEEYCDAHQNAYGSLIGDDGLFSPEIEAMLRSYFDLLNGERGRLQGMKMCEWRRRIAERSGINID